MKDSREDKPREYSPAEQRVADYIVGATNEQVGGGDDPIGFLIASHRLLTARSSCAAPDTEARRLLRIAHEQACGMTQQLHAEDWAAFGAPQYLIEIERFLDAPLPECAQPKCPGPDCMMCNGEACNKCGAGCWNNRERNCTHDVAERHEGAARSSSAEPEGYPGIAHDFEKMRSALEKIWRWFGEFPASGCFWPADAHREAEPMSYGAAFGSNGERDYMRKVAHDALPARSASAPAQEKP